MKRNPWKYLWLTSAFLCLGIGALGVILPILPTTPFLLVASGCFARGSDRFHRWFRQTGLYRKHLDSFVKERAMPMKTKLYILLPVSAMLFVAFVMMKSLPGRIVLVALILFKYVYFFKKIKTVPAVSYGYPESEKGGNNRWMNGTNRSGKCSNGMEITKTGKIRSRLWKCFGNFRKSVDI